MHLSPIQSPSGEPVFVVGHRHSWQQHTMKGYNVSLEWVGEGRKTQPCMCIWSASNVFLQSTATDGVWVIGRRAITEFVGFNDHDKCTGLASAHCLREAREALPILGKDSNDLNAWHALCDVVIRFAPDLVAMPVTPQAVRADLAGQATWEITTSNKATGQTINEVTI